MTDVVKLGRVDALATDIEAIKNRPQSQADNMRQTFERFEADLTNRLHRREAEKIAKIRVNDEKIDAEMEEHGRQIGSLQESIRNLSGSIQSLREEKRRFRGEEDKSFEKDAEYLKRMIGAQQAAIKALEG